MAESGTIAKAELGIQITSRRAGCDTTKQAEAIGAKVKL
jgi:hypothetical protein